jgi:hypothetical protein
MTIRLATSTALSYQRFNTQKIQIHDQFGQDTVGDSECKENRCDENNEVLKKLSEQDRN